MADSDGAVSSPTQPAPAPLGRRLVAGLIDGSLVVLLAGVCFWLHLTRAGSLAPMWTVAGIAVALNVLPAWATGATLGLRLVDLRLAGMDGSGPDLIELAIRELFGRGVVFIAYLSGFVVALVGSLIGSCRKTQKGPTEPGYEIKNFTIGV